MSDESRINFTKANLSKVEKPEDGKRAHIYDAGGADSVRGLLVRVTDKDERSFYVRRKVNGKSKWVKLGSIEEMSIEQARKAARKAIEDWREGKDPTQARRRAKEEMTLQDLFDLYIEKHAKVHCQTSSDMKDNFRRYAAPLAGKRLSEISYRDAASLQEKLFNTKGLHTSNRTVQMLRAVYNKGKNWRLFEGENPFQGLELHKEKERRRFLKNEEVGKLLSEAEKALPVNSAIHDFIKLSLFTGVRKANLLAMKWAHIDLDAKTWTIPGSETKNKESQVIILHDVEIEILERRKQEQKDRRLVSAFVFDGTGKTKHLTDPKKAWQTIRGNAGIADCTIHDLRRSLGSALANQNFNLAVIKHVLNHKDQKTTAKHYALAHDEAAGQARAAVQATWQEATEKAKKKKTTTVTPLKTKKKAASFSKS